jgi:Tfp pilus assembly protein PilV
MIPPTRRLPWKRADRRGFTLTETAVAMITLAAAIVAVAQLVSAVAAHRLTAEREALARQEASNLMERVFALPWAELTEENVAGWQLSETCVQQLPAPQLDISVESVDGAPVGRKIHIEVTWLDSSGTNRRTADLVAWRYAAEASQQ